MTKDEIIAKVNELIAAPSCYPGLKALAEAYLKDQNKATADALVKGLEECVQSIDSTINFAGSDAGKQIFGAERAAEMVKLGNELKAKGEKYCFCPRVRLEACCSRTKKLCNKKDTRGRSRCLSLPHAYLRPLGFALDFLENFFVSVVGLYDQDFRVTSGQQSSVEHVAPYSFVIDPARLREPHVS